MEDVVKVIQKASGFTRERNDAVVFSKPGYKGNTITVYQDGRIVIELVPDEEFGYCTSTLRNLANSL